MTAPQRGLRDACWAISIAVLVPACSAIVQPDVDRLREAVDGGRGGIDATASACEAGCDDAIACTVDVCSASGCAHSPDHAMCPDGQLCGPGGCMVAACGGDAECDDGRACNGSERCVDGVCGGGDAVVCDDGAECTEDTCDEVTGECASIARPERCGDGVDCTHDTCSPRSDEADDRGCVHAPDDGACDAECRVGGVCDPDVGCEGGDVRDCGDGDPCTSDRCEAPIGCMHELRDDDGDGHRVARIDSFPFGSTRCEGGTDCDDQRADVHPGAMETCRNGRDDDCDGRTDEGCGFP